MKHFIMMYSIIGILLLNGITVTFAEEQQDQTVHHMGEFVQKVSLQEFLQLIEVNSWRPPEIYSRWHMEYMATDKVQSQMNESQHFGRILISRLAEWKSLMTSATPRQQLHQDIESFLELADWLMETPGYGNMFLAVRCHDIATVGIGQLLINLDYPLEETQQLVDTLEASWYASSVRQHILNKEAGVELFISKSKQEADIQRVLQETWQTGSILQRRQHHQNRSDLDNTPQLKQPVSEGGEFLETPITQIIQRGSQVLKDNASFFEDDSLPTIITTESLWDKKWHYKFIIGFTLQNTVKLQALAAFRDAVGFYPTESSFTKEELKQREAEIRAAQEKGLKIIPFEEAFSSPGEAAFNQAWRSHATQDTYNLDARAWHTYEQIINGSFLDEDSRAEIMGKY